MIIYNRFITIRYSTFPKRRKMDVEDIERKFSIHENIGVYEMFIDKIMSLD